MGTDVERLNRLLVVPWRSLTPSEQEAALEEARRRGRWGYRSHARREMVEPWAPLGPPRPRSYLGAVLPTAPAIRAWAWRRMTVAELAYDPRVCAFSDAWERERRARRRLPDLPRDAGSLRTLLAEAVLDLRAAQAAYRSRAIQAARSGVEMEDDPLRLAMGESAVRLHQARERCLLAWMLLAAATRSGG